MWKAALAALAALFAASQAQAQPPVWVVRDHDSELVLFGSVHVLPKGLAWRPAVLTRALQSADDLWFELPIDPATEAQAAKAASAKGVLPPGQSLLALLPEGDAERLLKVAKTYGVDPAVLDRLQPWLAEVALTAGAYQKAGAGGDDGVEKAVAADAPATAARRAFETPEEQIAILADTPRAEQIASLSQTLRDMENSPDEFADLVRVWMKGDLAALDREALQPMRDASPGLFRRLVTDRNVRWTRELDARLKGKGRTVVVVGVGHLIGPDGVPQRLRALGYKVEGP
ncbi:TraB/GumN family protein [Phenylobacterium deserti]|uniref:TraB/GumN family protein n=1 Tax=Phenylobacterium deserti TaxID=1914756 RepID=A0A328AQ84_9CAUL|nr:TraB/GumN family protein [Phenylobacterium deserti]RAK57192.1 hypothetical protein DJ018_04365 [Phenylobacterium deserti]